MEDKGRPLTSPVYLSALALLTANDWLLKPFLHNALTGKLSDLAGVFAITWFGEVLFPHYRRLVSFSLAAAFVYWKSPHSDDSDLIYEYSFAYHALERWANRKYTVDRLENRGSASP
jgi:hypothetical protein